ncbi:hypothetical protein DL93DRAFT_2152411 [Clavulina sp. PMI_390]|nr:hypothetical protein DL93DRAFT_2152411 [Clavulina sp. PMI_390]
MCDYAACFWKTLRVRHRLRQSKVVLKPLFEPIHVSDQSRNSLKWLAGGNYILFPKFNHVEIFDIRARVQYKIAIPTGYRSAQWHASVMRFEDRDGILLAVSEWSSDHVARGIDILFQPFAVDLCSMTCPAVEHLATITPKLYGSFDTVALSAHRYIITSEIEWDDNDQHSGSFLQVYDLVNGEVHSLMSNFMLRDAKVCENDVLILLDTFHIGQSKAVRLADLHEDPKRSGSLRNVGFADHEPTPSFERSSALLHVWELVLPASWRDSGSPGPLVYAFHRGNYVEDHIPDNIPADAGSDTPSATPIWIIPPIRCELPSALVPKSNVQPYTGNNHFDQTRPDLSGSTMRRRHPILAPSDSGLWALNSPHAEGPATTLVLSELCASQSTPSFTHRLLYIYRDDLDAIEPFTFECSQDLGFNIKLDEYSGKVLTQYRKTEDGSRSTVINVYEAVPYP